jgi:sugar/nucleoside kinase (ribokinase family)
MTNAQYDITGLGNAIVDVLSYCDEAFIAGHKLPKGGMTLVDELRSQSIYKQLGQTTECSGGSVANTLAGMASLGSHTAFIGKVADDQLGKIFTHDMRSVGVRYHTKPAGAGAPSTANCLVMVTPDAQRTMATYIGACTLLDESDIDEDTVAAGKILYIEGYLWNGEHNKAAIRKAMSIAASHNRQVAMTLSDTFCVEGHRDEFLALAQNDLDILFANESEIKALLGAMTLDEAINEARGLCPIVAITCGEKGSVIVTNEHIHRVPTQPVAKLVDTTGAGDLFAAGFLHAHAKGKSLIECAELGNKCAGHIIQQLGARSMKPLKELVA